MSRHWAASAGFFVPESARSIWLSGDEPRLLNAAGGLVRRLHESLPQHRLACTTHRLDLLETLRSELPNDLILPAPFENGGALRRFWKALRPELLVWLGVPSVVSLRLLAQLSRAPVPLVVLDVGARDVVRLPLRCREDAALARSLFFGARDGEARAALIAAGYPEARVATTGSLCLARRSAAPAAEPDYLRRELGLGPSRVVLAAEGVTASSAGLLLDAFAALKRRRPELVLLLEPARANQAPELVSGCRQRGLAAVTRGAGEATGDRSDAIVLARSGELSGFYALAPAIVAAGTFTTGEAPRLNPVAAAARSRPLMFGPHRPADDDLARMFLAAGGALQVETAGFESALESCLVSPSIAAAGERAAQLVARHAGVEAAILEVLRPLLPPRGDARPIRQEWRVPSRVERLAATRVGQAALKPYRRRHIADWDALRERLGRPRSLLCLGNGPSSEDPELARLSHDALFRVNCPWLRRSFRKEPDVVFVGDMDSVLRVPSAIFAFRNIEWEGYQLFRRLLHGRRPPAFFTLERMPLLVSPDAWFARPTNGAFMILAAVMLAPERLILGGMDLFAHAAGRYPGELRSPNAYAQVHDRQVDLAFLKACLAQYRGELVITSEILRRALAEDPPPGGAPPHTPR